MPFGKICFVTMSSLLFLAGSMYQYFVKIVPTLYRKLNGEVSTKHSPLLFAAKVEYRCLMLCRLELYFLQDVALSCNTDGSTHSSAFHLVLYI